MPTKILPGGVAVIKGPRYDLDKVLSVCDLIVSALTLRFCGGETKVIWSKPGMREETPWPDPGIRVSRIVWSRMSHLYDVVDESLVYPVGDLFTLKVFALGKEWSVFYPERGEVRTPDDLDLSQLRTEPVIGVYGPEQEPDAYLFPEKSLIDQVERIVVEKAGHLGVRVDKSNVLPDQKDPAKLYQVAFIYFPHEAFGAGFGDIRIRCVLEDGSDPLTNSTPD